MDNLQKLQNSIRNYLWVLLLIENSLLIAAAWYGFTQTHLPSAVVLGTLAGLLIVFAALTAFAATNYFMPPVRALWQAILHLAPHQEEAIAAPDLKQLKVGQELVTGLVTQVYQLATVAEKVQASRQAQAPDLHRDFIASNLPLPLIVLDANEIIQFANQAAADYIGMHSEDLTGKNVYMVLDMVFPSESTFDKWLKGAKEHNATSVNSWERVRLNVRDNHPTRLFDLAAYYNRGNPQKWETMLVLFDHTKQYSQDDQAVSFIALSVHELRTPLMLLRGYIEAFDEELGGKLTPELNDFMLKMNATAQQLTAFVNNILNVARIDDDQLQLQLQEADWPSILKSTINNLELRAKVRGIAIEYSIAAGLPTVGVDRLSIQEVINNLVDNAIKYSGKSKVIKISTYLTKDGMVETAVQDFGVGVPTAIMSNLFTKFYRDHRNRAQIGGTGLGLYLSKAIVTAHGGNIWIRSKEGQGSTFGFTLMPYARLADELKNSGNTELVRGAHGWIKNHSLYRR